MEKYNTRNEVPEKYKWDLTIYYKNAEEFERVLEETKENIKKIPNYVGCTKSAERLYEYLENDVLIASEIMNLEVYAMTLSDSDLSESKPLEYVGATEELFTKYSMNNAFFEPELLSLSKENYNDLFNNEKLLKYKALLDNIYRYKDHILSEEEERIVSSLTQTLGSYGNISSTLLNSNHDYGKVIMEDGTEETLVGTNYRSIMKKLPRAKREEVYHQFYKVRDQYASTNAALLNNYVKTYVNLAKIHKFDSAWDRKLFNDKLNSKIFDSLVETCIEKKDVLKKYYKLREKVLKLDKLYPWDSPLELFELKREYSIEDAQNICLEAIKPLGEDYVEKFKTLIDNRAVDYCQYKGKRSGGYNVSTIGNRTSSILMSFLGDMDSVSTLIHEGGHYTHHTYIYDNNDAIYRDHSTIVAEVASLTNECLLSSYLVNNGTKEEALAGLASIIGIIINNLFNGVQAGDLEREFYIYAQNGGTLTKDYLYNLTEESLLKFYPITELDDEYQKCSWISMSHYYMHFYLFSYAICISVATVVANQILDGDKEILEKYKKFLSCGSDISIIDTFKVLEIDLEDKSLYANAIDYFEELLDKFDSIYEEVNNGSK